MMKMTILATPLLWLLGLVQIGGQEVCREVPWSAGPKEPTDYCSTITEPKMAHGLGLIECKKVASVIVDVSCTVESNMVASSCTLERSCPEGKFLSNTGACVRDHGYCFHNPNDRIPKIVTLPETKCSEKDWEDTLPKYCSIGKPGHDCQISGHKVFLHYVTDRNGVKRYVTRPSIEESQLGDKSDSYYVDPRISKTSSFVKGDSRYCSHLEPKSKTCYSKFSTIASPVYRIFNDTITSITLHLDGCSTPVYGYGMEEVEVFGKLVPESLSMQCTSCTSSCTNTELKVNIPNTGEKIVRYCARSGCQVYETDQTIIEIPRSFQSKISDEKVVLEIYDIKKTYSHSLETKCKIMEVCSAIDCHFCYIRLVNVNCYSWFHFVSVILASYFILLFVFLVISVLNPVWKAIYCVSYYVVKIFWKVMGSCCGYGAQKIQRLKQYGDDDEDLPLFELTQHRPATQKRTFTSGKPAKVSWQHLLVMAFLFQISFCDAGVLIKDGDAQCSVSVVDNVLSEMCTPSEDVMSCRLSSLIKVPLVSYDQTSCLSVLGPNGDMVGKLELTPMSLHYTCEKTSEFWTRDVVFDFEHIVRCPHAGQCTEEWCGQVDGDTKVEGFSTLPYPTKQFCRLGDACWGQGCFFCTKSCHIIRWFPKPRTDKVFEVFSCSTWKPSGTIMYKWTTENKKINGVLSLIHGEVKELSEDMSVQLDFKIQTQYPVLTRHFITDGDKIALVENSPTGQPIAGTIGSIQCQSKNKAMGLSDCVVAPKTCQCYPEGSNSGCECSQIRIDKAFYEKTQLPMQIGNDYLSSERDKVTLKTSAFGNADIIVRSSAVLRAAKSVTQECKIQIEPFKGCHSCLVASSAMYTCRTLKPTSAVVSCNDKVNLILSCDSTGEQKEVRAQFDTPFVDLACRSKCQKEDVFLSGTLHSVGFQVLNNGSNIVLSPVSSQLDYWSWAQQLWSQLNWGKFSHILGFFAFLFLLILVLHYILTRLSGKVKSS